MIAQYRLGLFLLITFALIMSACKSPSNSNQDQNTDNPSGNNTTMESIDVPSNFNWKTFTDYDLTIDAEEAGLVQVVSKKGTVYHRAYLSGKSAYTFILTVPTYETEVKLRHQGQEVLMDLSSKTLFHEFENTQMQNSKGGKVIAGL